MRIKQIHIIAILTTTGLLSVSCSQDGPINATQQEIQLLAETSAPLSRSSQALPTDYVLWTQGVYHNQFTDSYSFLFAQEQEFTANASGIWSHNGAPLYYPANGSVDFIAYAVKNASHKPSAEYSPSTLTAENSTFSSLTLDFGTKLDATDPVVFSDIKTVACGGTVPSQQLLFRYALSKIQFLARAENAETASRFTIYRLTVKDVNTSGKLQITPNVTTEVTIDDNMVTTGSTPSWTALNGTAQNLNAYSDSGVHPLCSATEGNTVGNALYLPTQTAATIDIEIEYTITNATSTTTAHLTKTVSLGTVNWLPEKQYTYTLVLNLTQIYVESQVNGAVLDSTPEDLDFDEQYHGTTPVQDP